MTIMTRSQTKAQTTSTTRSGGIRKSAYGRKLKVRVSDIRKSHQYFSHLSYTPVSTFAGGKCTKVTLGPCSRISADSDAKSSLPSGIKLARNTYVSQYKFIAGHLLNAQLGGIGTDYKNLTILTKKANADHYNKFEKHILLAVDELKKLYEFMSQDFINIRAVTHGIEVEIRVSDKKWGSQSPDSYIADHLICKAKVWTNIQDVLTKEQREKRNIKSQIDKISRLVNRVNNTKINNR